MTRRFAGKTTFAVASALVAAMAWCLAFDAGLGSHFNPDESRWISRAHYLADFVNPGSPTWDDQYMTRGQPPLGSYAMGLGLLLQGRDLETNPPWDFALPWEVNVAIGNKPVPADLAAGRAASAVLVAVTSLVVIILAHAFVSPSWAIAAGALYAMHPFTAYIGSIAMADALFGLLIALAAWAAAALARRPSRLRGITLGALLGLGGATKLSPLAVAAGLTAAMVLVVVVWSLRDRQAASDRRSWAVLGLAIGSAAILTFVAVYPYLWPDPVTRTQHLFAFRTEEMSAQASDWPVMAVPNRIEALRRTHANFFDRYNLSATVISRLGWGAASPWVRQIEIAVSGVGLCILTVRAARAGPFSPPALALAVLGGLVLVTILGMRSEFDRYHLPMALLGTVSAAATLDWVASAALHRDRNCLATFLSRVFARNLAANSARWPNDHKPQPLHSRD
jgi:4-amino-4-deoxy-L-arabinose transferase-like glycosyltransferase